MDAIQQDILREELKTMGRKVALLEKAIAKARAAVEVEEAVMTRKRTTLINYLKDEMEAREKYLDILRKLQNKS